jgi:hypothetical protein
MTHAETRGDPAVRRDIPPVGGARPRDHGDAPLDLAHHGPQERRALLGRQGLDLAGEARKDHPVHVRPDGEAHGAAESRGIHGAVRPEGRGQDRQDALQPFRHPPGVSPWSIL